MNDNTIKQESDPCILWLNTRAPRSVLYISFGSFATHGAPQLLELALGLEASNCSFLWLARPPNAGRMSAASGSPVSITEFLPPGFEERIEGRGKCYSGWAPQTRILKHPAVGGFLSHCGWNSTLEAVCSGVPLLAWPITAEQHLNRRFVFCSTFTFSHRQNTSLNMQATDSSTVGHDNLLKVGGGLQVDCDLEYDQSSASLWRFVYCEPW